MLRAEYPYLSSLWIQGYNGGYRGTRRGTLTDISSNSERRLLHEDLSDRRRTRPLMGKEKTG